MNAVKNAPDDRQEGQDESRGGDTEDRRVILLVEDNDADRDVYGGLLWYNGYNVLHAEEGEAAIALAMERRPDLILLDIMLTGDLTGLDVARRLRDEGLDMPLIVLSAVSREDLGSAVERAGITAYLEKPINPFDVVKEVMRRVGAARPRDR